MTGAEEDDPGHLLVRGAAEHNLKGIDVRVPLGRLVCVTGVSGSGKSTLVEEVCHRGLLKQLGRPRETPGRHEGIDGAEAIADVVLVDQSPIGKTSRSVPASYVGALDAIRKLFATEPLARERGYTAGRFSFNHADGRCPTCSGNGFEHLEMQFLSDVYLRCPDCDGRRFRADVLEVKIAPDGLSIAEVLDLTVDQAIARFADSPEIVRKLAPLAAVGLGYVTLGQPVPSLSGGEAQRLKLAGHLAGPSRGKGTARRPTGAEPGGGTLFLFDEPTTGLHFDDVATLLAAFRELIAAGDSVVVIEHHLDVIAAADWIVDLGPEGGDGGGEIVCEGPPAAVAAEPRSHTAGRELRAYFARWEEPGGATAGRAAAADGDGDGVTAGDPHDGDRTEHGERRRGGTGGGTGARSTTCARARAAWPPDARAGCTSETAPGHRTARLLPLASGRPRRATRRPEAIEIRRARDHNLKDIDVKLPRDRVIANHRGQREREEHPRVRHRVRGRAAPLPRVAQRLRAAVRAAGRPARRGRGPRDPADRRHRAADESRGSQEHRGDGHRDPPLPAPAVLEARGPALSGLRAAHRVADPGRGGGERDAGVPGPLGRAARAPRRRPQGLLHGPRPVGGAQGLFAPAGGRRAPADRRLAASRPLPRARHRPPGRGPHRGPRRRAGPPHRPRHRSGARTVARDRGRASRRPRIANGRRAGGRATGRGRRRPGRRRESHRHPTGGGARRERRYSTARACAGCGRSFDELDPRLFSFNSRHGWCPGCRGTGLAPAAPASASASPPLAAAPGGAAARAPATAPRASRARWPSTSARSCRRAPRRAWAFRAATAAATGCGPKRGRFASGIGRSAGSAVSRSPRPAPGRRISPSTGGTRRWPGISWRSSARGSTS